MPTPVPEVEPSPLAPTVAPRLVGRPRAGQVLRVRRGDWPVAQVRLRFRWYVDGVRLRGAAGRRLRLDRRLAGARISVRVVARADGHEPWRRRLHLPD